MAIAVSDAMLIAGATGCISAAGTVGALRVHINNLRERLDRMRDWVMKVEARLEATRDEIHQK